jgi:O-antigen/teichoic acid export membrane protein
VHNERRILFNTVALSGSEGLGQLANLLLIVSFARHFGAVVLGYYSIGMSIGAVASVLVSLGLEGMLIRDISQDPACGSDRLGVLLPVQMVLAPLAWAGACAVSMALIGNTAALLVVVAASGYQVLLPLGSLLLTPLRAREQMLVASCCNVSNRLLSLLIGLVALRLGAKPGIVALAFIAGASFLIAVAWIQTTRRCGRPRLRWSPREAWALYRRGAPFFGMSALSTIYTRGTTIALGALSASQQVGLYAVADRLMIPLSLGPAAFNAAVYPALSRLTQQSLDGARVLCGRCVRLLLVVTVPFAAFAAIFAAQITALFFGRAYLGAAAALQVLAWTLPVRGVQFLLGSQLAAIHRQATVARARFAGLCAFAVLAPLLIVTGGYVGAAWALLLCDCVQLALYAWSLHRLHAAPVISAPLLAPAAAAALTGAASLLFPALHLAWRLPAMLLVMATGLSAFGAVKLHDLRFLRALIAGR